MTLIPTTVTFRGLAHSDALEADVREQVARLEQFYGGIVGCRVLIEVPHRHQRGGRHFHVRIEVTVPGGSPIIVSHEPSLHGSLKDNEEAEHHRSAEIDSVQRHRRVAVHQAFDTARRQLQDFAREHRGAVKMHEAPAHGRVSEISKVDGYGFIQEGERRIYFSRASVLDGDFNALAVGTPVVFVEEMGEKGPQASTVRVIGKHHYVAH